MRIILLVGDVVFVDSGCMWWPRQSKDIPCGFSLPDVLASCRRSIDECMGIDLRVCIFSKRREIPVQDEIDDENALFQNIPSRDTSLWYFKVFLGTPVLLNIRHYSLRFRNSLCVYLGVCFLKYSSTRMYGLYYSEIP
jgi:hypothetical protein